LRRVEHLDGGHAHVARWLQVDAEIVKINAAFGVDAERLDHRPVDPRIGFPETDFGGLDDMIEQSHHFRDVQRTAAEAPDRIGRQVVGDAPGLEAGLHAPKCFDHLRPQIA
jgi:hypothetical protein